MVEYLKVTKHLLNTELVTSKRLKPHLDSSRYFLKCLHRGDWIYPELASLVVDTSKSSLDTSIPFRHLQSLLDISSHLSNMHLPAVRTEVAKRALYYYGCMNYPNRVFTRLSH